MAANMMTMMAATKMNPVVEVLAPEWEERLTIV
jgi:hypothetical protein